MSECYIKVLPDFEKNKNLKNKDIIVFGLGRLGKRVVDFALSRDYNIIEIWDNYSKVNKYRGINVCKPHNNMDKNLPVIISAYVSKVDEIFIKQAINLGYTNILDFGELFVLEKLSYEEYNQFVNNIQRFRIKKTYSNKENIFSLPHIEIPITEKCTLRCKECADMMQYFKNPKDLDLNEHLQDVKALLSSVDYIEEIRILGGEPFICKNLHYYIKELLKYNNIGIITVITNGTLIPTNENLNCLKSNRVQVEISDYGKLSKKMSQLKELFKREKILYTILSYENWIECSGISKHNRTKDDNKAILLDCSTKWCLTIRNHKLFRCAFIAHGWHLKAIPEEDVEYVNLNITDNFKIRENLKSYLNKDMLLACDYCSGRSITNCSKCCVAEQIDRPLEYYKYNN